MPAEDDYLAPAKFIDSNTANIVAFAKDATRGAADEIDRAVRISRAVRDGVTYDPYVDYRDIEIYRASSVLAAGRGYCVGKAAVLAACARALGIPARLGFADVRNHLTSRKLYEVFQSDVFRWHAYVDLHVDGKWVKATPAFDARLCAKVNIAPLEFDGRSDSLFQPFDPAGRRHMEYLADHGTFADVPVETLIEQLRIHYPAVYAGTKLSGDFAAEAIAG